MRCCYGDLSRTKTPVERIVNRILLHFHLAACVTLLKTCYAVTKVIKLNAYLESIVWVSFADLVTTERGNKKAVYRVSMAFRLVPATG